MGEIDVVDALCAERKRREEAEDRVAELESYVAKLQAKNKLRAKNKRLDEELLCAADKAIRNYHTQFQQDEDGNPLSLTDAFCAPRDKSITRGAKEIYALLDEVCGAMRDVIKIQRGETEKEEE